MVPSCLATGAGKWASRWTCGCPKQDQSRVKNGESGPAVLSVSRFLIRHMLLRTSYSSRFLSLTVVFGL